jgi:pyrimidine operon attenuation protein / uracil phosphoribosyltransferase
MTSDKMILSADTANKKMKRMAYEILERNVEEKKLILAGIRGNGLIIANIMRDLLKEIFNGDIDAIEINIDKKLPKQISIPAGYNFEKSVVIITDDVSNSGRTLLYALKPFLDFYPKKVQTLVLVERSYKQFPITPDYSGLSVSTTLNERIIVETSGNEITGARLE